MTINQGKKIKTRLIFTKFSSIDCFNKLNVKIDSFLISISNQIDNAIYNLIIEFEKRKLAFEKVFEGNLINSKHYNLIIGLEVKFFDVWETIF